MDATRLTRIQGELQKLAQGQAVILPQVATPTGRRKKKLSPEAVETIRQLQETPRDIYGGFPGSTLLSTAVGGGVGGTLTGMLTRATTTGEPIRYSQKGLEELAKVTPQQALLNKARLRRGVAIGTGVGAGLGLASNLAYQARKKHLKEKLEEELGNKKKEKTSADVLQTTKLMVPAGSAPAKYLPKADTGRPSPQLAERQQAFGIKSNYFAKKTQAVNSPSWGNRRRFKKMRDTAIEMGMPVKKWDEEMNKSTLMSNPFQPPKAKTTASIGQKGEALGAGVGLVAGATLGATLFKKKVPKPVQKEVVKAVKEVPKIVPGAAGVVRELGHIPVAVVEALGKLPLHFGKSVGQAAKPKTRFSAGVMGGLAGLTAGTIAGRVLGETGEVMAKKTEKHGHLLKMAAHSRAVNLMEGQS